jgi:alpha-1,3-glucosyltransferase
MDDLKFYKYLMLVMLGVGLRSTISLHPYSGQNNPPMFGDFEAQRHWQEVTVNLPVKDWYENTTNNDLLYWGLDYPPLTAYHSFIVGQFAKRVDESYVELHQSRGISTDAHKNFMRLSVIAADVLIYIPALVIACKIIFERIFKINQAKSRGFYYVFLSVALFYPGQILIDNGHFQYNNVSLGFAVLAVIGILMNRRIFAAVFFVFALNYKQMELYHALPFFFYLLSNCFFDPDSHKK